MGTTKTITVAIDVVGKLDKLSSGLKQVQNQLGNFDLTAGLEKEFSSTLTKLFKQIDRASELSSGGKLKLIDEKAFNKAISDIENAYDDLISKLERQGVNTSFLKEDAKVLKTLTNLQNKYEEKIKDSLKEQKKLTRELEKAKNNLTDGPKIAKGKTPVDQAKHDSLKDTERKLYQAYKKAEQERKDAETAAIARANSDSKYGGDITGKNFKLTKEGKALTAATKEATKAAEDYNKQVKLIESTVLQSRVDEAWDKLKENVAKAEQNLNNFNQSQNNIKTQAIDDLKNSLNQIIDINWDEIGIDINKINSIEDFENILTQIGTDSAKRAAEALKQIKGETTELDKPLKQAAAAARESSNALHEMASREREIEDLQRRLISFFSIDNTIQLFKRAVRDAYETVKELDAAATETAVVTDFSVSDMWDQLPRYTEEANKLGTTTLGAYETMTLFYQQGLKTNEAFEIGTETMKMARIANMDYAVATDKMTAALRGFNMELNQTSAQRVNDVYSELAAITAADTNEIATAMTKTASIADSANMEFETTAAFLSQIIETTRESAETAGTAMKTVVARFQELKKDPAEIGEVDGEIVDANKIETALRTINVALRDTSGQFRDLDDVFLEIASKWNTLDTNTQRYIATMAAGSRQQSRFIAMMSNYDRTMELVNAANNSAGASQRQFEKTTESLESKLNKLKNAWNAFTMGITNSEVIKFGVDLLTTFLTVINKLIDGISGGNGLIKSLLSLGITLGGLSIGKNLVIGLSADLAKTFTNLGKDGADAWSKGLTEGFKTSGKNLQKTVKNIFNKNLWKGGTLIDLSILEKENTEAAKKAGELSRSLNIDPQSDYYKKVLENRSIALKNFTEMQEASIGQQSLYNAMVSKGIPAQTAATLALNNASEEEIKNAIAKQLGAEATEEKIKELYKETMATASNNTIKNLGLITITKETFAILKNAVAEGINTKEVQKNTIAKLVNIGVNKKLAGSLVRVISLLASPVFWVAAAGITAIGTAFYLLWKNSPAQQLKEAQEAAEKAGNAADIAADKYNNLKTSLDEIGEKKSNLDELTKGTQEWNEAVFELNQQILQLMKDYPELVNFISKNSDGVLTIDYETADNNGKTANDIINKAFENQFRTAAASNATQINLLKAEDELATQEISGGVGKQTRQIIKELGLAISAGDLKITDDKAKDEVANFLMGKGIDRIEASRLSTVLTQDIDSLLEFSNQLSSSSKQIQILEDSIASNAHEMANLTGYADDVIEASLNYTKTFANQNQDTVYNDYLREIDLFSRGFTNDSSLIDKFLVDSGYTYEGTAFDKLKFKNGDEVIKLTKEEVATRIAAAESIEVLAEKEEKFAKQIEKIEDTLNTETKKIGTGFKNLFAGREGSGLTNLDLTEAFEINFDSDINEDNLKSQAQEIWKTLDETKKELFNSETEFLEFFVNSVTLATNTFKKAKEDLDYLKLNDLSLDLDKYKFSASTVSGYSDTLIEIYTKSGREGAEKLKAEIDNVLNQLDVEKADAFIGALNGIDTTSIDSIKNLSNKLEELEIDLSNCGINIDDLENDLIDLGNASKNVDLETAIEQIKGLAEIKADLKTGEQGRQFSEEQRDKLIAAGINENDFVLDLEDGTYNYIGESTDLIVAAIEQQTLDLLNRRNIDTTVASGEAYKDAFEEIEFERKKAQKSGETDKTVLTMQSLAVWQKAMEEKGFGDHGYFSPEVVFGDWQANYDSSDKKAQKLIAEQIDAIWQRIISDSVNLTSNKVIQEEVANSTASLGGFATRYEAEQAIYAEDSTTSDKGEYTSALLAEAGRFEVLENEISELNKAIASGDKELIKAKKQQLAYGVAVQTSAEKLDQLDDEAQEHLEALENIDKKSEEYTSTLDELAKDVNRAFGSELTGEFFSQDDEKNLKLFKKALEGDQEAWEQFIINADIARLSVADFTKQYQLSGEDITGITAALNGLEFNINGRADMTQVLKSLIAAGMTGQEVADFLEKLGYTYIEFEARGNLGKITDLTSLDTKELSQLLSQGSILTFEATKREIPAARTLSSFGSGGRNSGSKKSSSGGSSKSWENPYDKFYNLTESINKNLREREKLERTYNKLLREQQHILNTIEYEKNLSDQISNLKQQADKLRREYALQSTMYSGKGNELQSYMAKNSSMRKYGYYDAASQQIVIDWNAINKVKDDEKGQKIEDYIGKLEELRDAMWDAEDAMLDAEEQIEEMKEDLREKLEELKQAYLDFEDRIVEALVAQRQAEIDELQEVYDLMSESNNSVLSAIQEVISEQRRLRELEEQKADIEEMQRRLAMLRQDTSGASDLEIKALEEQIGDAQQSYTDSLIDQAIDEMGTANEKAEEQRQQQIDLLQHQLDWDKENGKFWAQVNELLSTAINPDGSLNNNSPLVELLKSTEGYKAMSEFGKQNWWTNLQKTVAEAMAGLKEWLNPTDVDAEIGGAQGGDAGIVGDIGSDDGGSGDSGGSGGGSGVLARGENVKTLQRFLKNHWGKNIEDDGVYGSKTKKAVKEVQKTLNDSGAVAGGRIQEDGLYGADTQNAIRIFYSRTGRSNIAIPAPMFKTGGLADFTGPAWLDGTKTHPEIVLNARDTANFLELRDILRDMNLISDGKTSGGDNYFEIHIEVDTLSNDYDVEQVADKVKRIINDDARYRNTNAINLIR